MSVKSSSRTESIKGLDELTERQQQLKRERAQGGRRDYTNVREVFTELCMDVGVGTLTVSITEEKNRS